MKPILHRASATLLLVIFAVTISCNAVGALSLPMPHMVASAASNEACTGAGLVTDASGTCEGDNGLALGGTITTIINLLSAIVGVVAVIMIIVAGLQFITSNGNPQNVAKARSSLIYALVGVVIVVLAETIVHFVINQVQS
jgi:type IV secretion system pilin